jgi:hypothetical protein
MTVSSKEKKIKRREEHLMSILTNADMSGSLRYIEGSGIEPYRWFVLEQHDSPTYYIHLTETSKTSKYNSIKQEINKDISTISSQNENVKKYFNISAERVSINNLNQIKNFNTKLNISEKNRHVKIIKNTGQFGPVSQNYDIFSFIFELTVKTFKSKFKDFMDNILGKRPIDLIDLFQLLYNKRRQIYILDNNQKNKVILVKQLQMYDMFLMNHVVEHPFNMDRFESYYMRLYNNFKKWDTGERSDPTYIVGPQPLKCIQYEKDGMFYNHILYIARGDGISLTKVNNSSFEKSSFETIRKLRLMFYTIYDSYIPYLIVKYKAILYNIIFLIKNLKDTTEKDTILDIIIKIYFHFIYVMLAEAGTASCGEMLLYSLLELYDLNYKINENILLDCEVLTSRIDVFVYKCTNEVNVGSEWYVEGDEEMTPFLIKV